MPRTAATLTPSLTDGALSSAAPPVTAPPAATPLVSTPPSAGLRARRRTPAEPAPSSPTLKRRQASTTARQHVGTPQCTAASRRTPFGPVDPRPLITELVLPGPRREREGRGGAMATTDMLRLLIRSPLLPVFTAVLPRRTKGRPAAVPDHFWVFYLTGIRVFASAEKLDQELRCHWELVREEFWFAHGVLLPDAKRNGSVPGSSSYRKWRDRNVVITDDVVRTAETLSALRAQLTTASLPLALAIRSAEGGDAPRDLLTPKIWDCVAADGSVFNAPSDVRLVIETDDNGEEVSLTVTGSRAKDLANARVHHEVTSASGKPHGAKEGLFNVVAVTKGVATYTRVVLGVDIGAAGEGETPIAMRVLRGVYDQAGQVFPVLLYDGAITPVHYQALLAEYGIYCVNANHARKGGKGRATPVPGALQAPVGQGQRRYGRNGGEFKRTYFTALPSITHRDAAGAEHSHHLVADDGAVYETDRPMLSGGQADKLQVLRPSDLQRCLDAHGAYYLQLELTGQCDHGGNFQVSYDLRSSGSTRVPWTALIANIRVLPDALITQFSEVYGQRNQVESFFSWLERCFWTKDRAACWGREAQLLDLLGAALLHNSITWAHLAYRHPLAAEQLAQDLAALMTQPEAKAAVARG